MAEQNPIKYSDLIIPDDSIERLIRQLESLQATYTGLSQSVRSQAAAMAESLKSVSGATENGRQSTRSAATDADRLAKAYRDLEFAQSDTAKRIAELKEVQKEQNYMNKLSVQSARAVEGSYNALSAQYRQNKLVINNLTQAERENDPAAKKLIEDTKQIYEQMKKMQEETGKCTLNVGNYEQSITNALGAQSKWFKGMRELGALFGGGFSNGVKAAGSAVASFGKQLLALLANPIVATIAAITAAFMALAKGISSSEENTMALQRVLAPFQRILTGIVSVLQKMASGIIWVLDGAEKLTMALSRQLEKLPLVGNALRKVNDALEDNIRLTKEKQFLEKAERSKDEANAKLARDVAMYKNLAAGTNDAALKVHYLKMAREGERKILMNNLNLARRNLARLEKESKLAENDAEANKELAAARIAVYKAEEDYYNHTTRIEKQLANQRKKDNGGGGGKGGNAVDTAKDEAEELLRLQQQKDKRRLDAMRQMQDAQAGLIKDSYDREYVQTELAYDRQIEDLKAHMKELGDDEVEAKEMTNKTIIALEAQKWDKLAEIAEKKGQAAADAEKEDYEKRIKATDKMTAEQEKKAEEQRKKTLQAQQEFKQAIGEAMQYAIDSLYEFLDAWVQVAEQRKAQADSEVERTKAVLDAEIEARNAGYANEVETARKEYEAAKKQQQKALKEQQKAQQAQEALDTATQVSSLVTATANIWKTYSAEPYVGTALAIAATALMWGSFAAAKIKAAEVAGTGSEEYGEGTVELLQGGSHQSGNDIDLGRKKDGTRRRAEGGEFFAVINKRSSRRYRDIIPDVVNALNDGTFAEKYMGAYEGGVMVDVSRHAELGSLPDDVRMIREQGESRQWVDGHGNTVEQYKNLKKTIYN